MNMFLSLRKLLSHYLARHQLFRFVGTSAQNSEVETHKRSSVAIASAMEGKTWRNRRKKKFATTKKKCEAGRLLWVVNQGPDTNREPDRTARKCDI
jgi:hypothetical protein